MPWLAYLTLFLAALLEAVPVVGSVIPGSTIILALSALVPGGELRLRMGAGGRDRRRVARRRIGVLDRASRQARNPQRLADDAVIRGVVAQSEAFFHRWGALAVFFARFVPPIRAFVPITAGALGMPPLRFYAVNIPAILLWAPAHVLPGVLAVSALHEYAGLPHHRAVGKHHWILAVIGGALDRRRWRSGLIRRRHGGDVRDRSRGGNDRIATSEAQFEGLPWRKPVMLDAFASRLAGLRPGAGPT